MAGLLEDHIAGVVMLPRIKASAVVTIVIEEVQNDFLLAAKIQQLLVDGHFSKDEQFPNVFHRHIFASLRPFKIKGVSFAL